MELQLRQAADVATGHHIGSRGHYCPGLLLAESGGNLRLVNVVAAGTAAAELAVGNLHEFQARDRPQQLPRLGADLLRIGQMAGILIGHLERHFPQRLTQAKPAQKRAHVDHFGAEGFGLRLVGGATQDEVILMQGRSAAGRIGEDRIDVARKGLQVAPGKGLCRGQVAGMPGEPAAAALPPRHHHLHPLARQHGDRGGVDVGREHLLRTAGEQRHSGPPHATRRRYLGPGFCSGKRIGNQFQHPLPSTGRYRFGEAAGQHRQAEAGGIGECLRHKKSPRPLQPSALYMPLGKRAKRTDQVAVRHAAGTGRLAGEAAEAAVDMRRGGSKTERALEHLLHQHDPPARRIHLLPQFLVGRAGGETKTAVHAGRYCLRHRLSKWSQRFARNGVLHQSSSEGKRWSGSKACLTAASTAYRGRPPTHSGAFPASVRPTRWAGSFSALSTEQ